MTLHRTSRGRAATLAALALSTGLVGCAKDEQSGTLTVTYRLGNNRPCDMPSLAAGQVVSTIRVTLTNGDGTVTRDEACGEEEILIDGIDAANYDVLVEGVDAVGDTIMDNIDVPPDEDEKVEIVGGTSKTLDAALAATPATIEMRLNIQKDGAFAQCQFADVQFFNVIPFGAGDELTEVEVDYCDAPPGFSAVPDEDRLINGVLLDGVLVEVSDKSHNAVEEVSFDFAPPGAGKTVQLTIDCDNTTCMGTAEFPGGGGGGDGGTAGEDDGDGDGDDDDGSGGSGAATDGGDDTTGG